MELYEKVGVKHNHISVPVQKEMQEFLSCDYCFCTHIRVCKHIHHFCVQGTKTKHTSVLCELCFDKHFIVSLAIGQNSTQYNVVLRQMFIT